MRAWIRLLAPTTMSSRTTSLLWLYKSRSSGAFPTIPRVRDRAGVGEVARMFGEARALSFMQRLSLVGACFVSCLGGARFGSVLRKTNSEIVQVLKPGSEMLANLQQEFHTMLDDRTKNHKKTMEIFCLRRKGSVQSRGSIQIPTWVRCRPIPVSLDSIRQHLATRISSHDSAVGRK